MTSDSLFIQIKLFHSILFFPSMNETKQMKYEIDIYTVFQLELAKCSSGTMVVGLVQW